MEGEEGAGGGKGWVQGAGEAEGVEVEGMGDTEGGGWGKRLFAEGEGGELGSGAQVVDVGDVVVVEVEGEEAGVVGDIEGVEVVVGEVEGLQVSEGFRCVRTEIGELVVIWGMLDELLTAAWLDGGTYQGGGSPMQVSSAGPGRPAEGFHSSRVRIVEC